MLICTPVVNIIALSLFTMTDWLVEGILIVEHTVYTTSFQNSIYLVQKVLQVAYPKLMPILALTHHGPCLSSSSENHDSHWPITATNILYLNCKIISHFDSKQLKGCISPSKYFGILHYTIWLIPVKTCNHIICI